MARPIARPIALALASGLFAGCALWGGDRAASEPTVNTGLDQLLGEPDPAPAADRPRSPEDIRDWLARDALVLPSLSRGEVPGQPPDAATPPSANPTPAVAVSPPASPAEDAPAPAPGGRASASGAPTPTPVVTETPTARRQRLARELADALRASVRESDAPLREYAALAALDLIVPGLAPDPQTIPALTPREVDLLGAWRELFRVVDEGLTSAPDDAGALADAVDRLAGSMSQWRTLGVAHAALCSRVEGFGQYEPLPSARMLAGRPNPAIVYVEVEHFTHSASADRAGEPGYAVELTQELSLYHDADGLLAWRLPAQTIRDVSRRRRRDFFIVQRIDLPPTLTVGAYRLKVTLREPATGAVAEAVLPVEMVADAALVRAR